MISCLLNLDKFKNRLTNLFKTGLLPDDLQYHYQLNVIPAFNLKANIIKGVKATSTIHTP